MKKHAIIPIFIPHKGCPNDCVFCNQRKITARITAPSSDEVRSTIEEWLTTLEPKRVCNGGTIEELEVSFFGGSFTGLTIAEQSMYLAIAKEYLDEKRIDGIHLSTRPDYITEEILDNLKNYGVGTIEIGVQSFDDDVLRASNRGHDSDAVYKAVELIKNYGFKLGIQLMIGLPGDSLESCIYSAKETAKLHPELARLYPTIVLDDTRLLDMYNAGTYTALSSEEAVKRTLAMYKILDDAGIYIMRVGLKSTDIIGNGGAINGGTYHPAFRQLVEGRLLREKAESLIKEYIKNNSEVCDANEGEMAIGNLYTDKDSGKNKNKDTDRFKHKPIISLYSNEEWYSNMIGNCAENKKYFKEKYPDLIIKYRKDNSLADKELRLDY